MCSIDDVRKYINDESWIPNALLELDAKFKEIDSRRLRVRVLATNHSLKTLRPGDEGYIDGYMRGADDRPYAVVYVYNRGIELIPFYSLEVLHGPN
jgi:hypothetical protein